MGHQLHHGAVERDGAAVHAGAARGCGHSGDGEQHVAHVVDRRVGDQALDVAADVGQGAEGPRHDAHQGQGAQHRGKVLAGIGHQRQHNAQHAVGAHLAHHGAQQDASGHRRFGVGVGQPGVEGPRAQLDREGHKDRPERDTRVEQRVAPENISHADPLHVAEDDLAQRARHALHRQASPKPPELDQVECWQAGVAHGQVDQLEEQQQADRAGHGVDEELKGGGAAPIAPPALDQEEGRDEAELPEDKEEEKVQRQKVAKHGRLEQQQQREVRLHPLRHAPGRRQRHGRHHHGEQQQRQA